MESMERLMAGRTTFMVAHRLTTLDVCDVVAQVGEQRVKLGS
jgi:ATP-binding cassette subfamily B protein